MRFLIFILLSVATGLAQVPLLKNPAFIASITKPAAAGGGGGCTTPRDSITGASVASANNVITRYKATSFVAGASTTICAGNLYLSKSGTPAGDMTLEIWTNSGSSPGTLIDASATIAATALTGSEASTSFASGLSAAVTMGTTYWVVWHVTANGDGTDNAKWYYRGLGTGELKESDDGMSWGTVDSVGGKFELFSN